MSNCASNEEIDQYKVGIFRFNQNKFQLYFNTQLSQKSRRIDDITNANLYYSYSFHQLNKESDDSPYQKTENIDLTSLYQKVGKYIKIYFQYSQSFLEYNPFYFFPRSVYHEGIEYQKTITDSVLYFQDANTLARIEVHLDAKKKICFITYQTLMDVIAKLGGLFTIIRALLDFIIFPIQSMLYKLFLINFLISHQDRTNHIEPQQLEDEKKKISIQKLITSSATRKLFYQQTQIINKYLDVRQILIHPLQFSQKIEGLQDSIKKYDILSSRQIKLISKQEIDELVIQSNHEENADYRCLSYGTINSENKIRKLDKYVIPQIKVQIH